MYAGADSVVESREVRVLTVGAAACRDAIGFEPDLAAALSPVGNNAHGPRLFVVLCQPTRIQQRRFAQTNGTGYLSAEKLTDVVMLRNVKN